MGRQKKFQRLRRLDARWPGARVLVPMLGAWLAWSAGGAAEVITAPLSGALTCTADDALNVRTWQLEIDARSFSVRVDGRAVDAVVSATHVEIRLAPAGPVLTVGRRTGRLLVSALDGRPLARGACRPLPRA